MASPAQAALSRINNECSAEVTARVVSVLSVERRYPQFKDAKGVPAVFTEVDMEIELVSVGRTSCALYGSGKRFKVGVMKNIAFVDPNLSVHPGMTLSGFLERRFADKRSSGGEDPADIYYGFENGAFFYFDRIVLAG